MTSTIEFNKTGYDPFIDFIKAFAIVCVVVGHTMPFLNFVGDPLWISMQVPLFILVQVFHAYKRRVPSFNLSKILSRVLLPYFLIQIVTICIITFVDPTISLPERLSQIIPMGGGGPGSYYLTCPDIGLQE